MKTFKYEGSDPSYIYKYFHSPLADFLVNHFVPSWLAPNVITLIGFSFTLIVHFIFFYYSKGELQAPHFPPVLHLLAAISLFLYSVFDNMDGKQARKIKNSSILGATLDHGVDCLNAGIIGITVITSVNMQNIKGYYGMAVVGFLPIFTAAWEEYHLGGMFMPVINGPNEGLLALEISHLLTYFYGPTFWEIEAYFGLNRAEIFMVYCIIQGQITSIQNFYRVLKCKNKGSIIQKLQRLGILGFIFLCIIIIQVFSPTNIAVRKGRWIIYFFLFGWAKCVTLIHLWYATGQELKLFRPSVVIPFALFTCNTVVGYFSGQAPIDEDILLYIGTGVMAIVYLHFATSLIIHVADILKVPIFSVLKQKRKE